MTPRPLGEIRLRPSDHFSALWWLGLLYRRPARFRDTLYEYSGLQQLTTACCLFFHVLPYILVLSTVGMRCLSGVSAVPADRSRASGNESLIVQVSQTVVGLVIGLAGGTAVGLAGGLAAGLAIWLAIVIAGGIALGLAVVCSGALAFGLGAGVLGRIIGGVVRWVAYPIAFGLVLSLGSGLGVGFASAFSLGFPFAFAFGFAFGLGFVIASLRCFYHVVHPIFVWPSIHGSWYRFHPVAWDDLCAVPFPELDRLLVAFAEHAPAAGTAEIERLVERYPSQRLAALRAQACLVAREAGRAIDLSQLRHLVARLPKGEKGFLQETSVLQEKIREIAHLQERFGAIDRPVFRETLARLLRTEIENFLHHVHGFHEPLASEFRTAAVQWSLIADRQLQDAQAVLKREPTPQIFRAGDPVDREREAFVPRDRVVGKLEQQVALSTGCPGLVLYGRRRMGKTTVLHNLGGFLPTKIRVVHISMQLPEATVSLESLITLLGDVLRVTWPAGGPPAFPRRDLNGLFRLLARYNDALGNEARRLVLAVDEYENIDRKIGEGIFPEEFLALVRESIQFHRNLTWVFAGSHAIDELTHAPWTSYLVSARTIEVPPFTLAETRLLLTEPLKFSRLWPKDELSLPRPSFSAEFWGPGGIERIHAEAAGWPHLVQLIAETIVDLLNDEGLREVDRKLFERALDEAIVRGHNVLYELMHRESFLSGEWEYISVFRKQEAQPPPEDETIARSLRRRLLVVEEGAGGPWRLRVPLMRRWLVERG